MANWPGAQVWPPHWLVCGLIDGYIVSYMRLNLFSPKLFIGLAALLLALPPISGRGAAPSDVVLGNSIRPVGKMTVGGAINPHHAYISRTALKAAESAEPLMFEVSLKMRNFAEMKARVQAGDRISVEELAAKYEPTAADYQAVVDWLKAQGFTILQTDPHHLEVFAQGKVSEVAQGLKVNFARVTLNGDEYTSAVSAPTVPANISAMLTGIKRPAAAPARAQNTRSCRKRTRSPAAPRTRRPRSRKAYQVNGLYSQGIDGTGQTIAIVIDTFPAKSDLVAFWDSYGINQSINNFTFVQTVSGTLPATTGEETLDTEWSSAMAPGAKVRVYASLDLSFAHVDRSYSQILTDASSLPIHQMSMSFGLGETEYENEDPDTGDPNGQPISEVTNDDTLFVELANAGVTAFASSGDDGATPEGIDGNGDDIPALLQVEFPSSDPNVIGVGGTTLTLDSNNNESTEVVWNEGSTGGAGGGGTSIFFSRPSWQPSSSAIAGTMRLVPDISCAADPDYGADFYYHRPDHHTAEPGRWHHRRHELGLADLRRFLRADQ